MRNISLTFLCLLLCVFVTLTGCDRKVKEENIKLKEKVSQLQAEIDSLKSIISELQRTDNYYYQMGISSRQSKRYEESNRYLNEMIERFPQSRFISDARYLISKNNDDIAQSLYDRAVSAQRSEQYQLSNELLDELLTKFPKSSLIYKAKEIKRAN